MKTKLYYILIFMLLILGGGYLAKQLGKKEALKTDVHIKASIMAELDQYKCCDESADLTVSTLHFHSPYDWGKAYVDCLKDSVTFYLDGKVSSNAQVIDIKIPGCNDPKATGKGSNTALNLGRKTNSFSIVKGIL